MNLKPLWKWAKDKGPLYVAGISVGFLTAYLILFFVNPTKAAILWDMIVSTISPTTQP